MENTNEHHDQPTNEPQEGSVLIDADTAIAAWNAALVDHQRRLERLEAGQKAQGVTQEVQQVALSAMSMALEQREARLTVLSKLLDEMNVRVQVLERGARGRADA
jgi:hypothetical protein